ncbi:HEPN domain-containing protein [Ancylomarina sp. 16SWW S1-10-2]|uniref:HEPN domain-containing protein n=1 Tax=Ancylomarina sp. 16SWW S1-10-2 TaxID=2499681 RepID=UPI0012AE7400|nr:HEPN domain-containing protein [Ancylomarina sp. 16SWW S1-10-2]MRT94044.1 hypothetical protein [Ancylomarina sp. 16SWW S1-10-2]
MVTKVFKNFENILDDLKVTVTSCNEIIISDSPLNFVYENSNFLTKSFLISLCGYLETYIKDVLELLINDYNERISAEKYPYNLIRWSIENKDKNDSKIQALLDKKKGRYEDLEIKIKKKDLDPFISGNPFRTRELFTMFGIDLNNVDAFNNRKDIINQIIVKRNNILHHNDEASNLSNLDVILYITEIRDYCIQLDSQIEQRITNRQQCV